MQNWSLHDAKNRFSALVEAAQRGQPQLVTKRGAPAVVVVAADEFERLEALQGAAGAILCGASARHAAG